MSVTTFRPWTSVLPCDVTDVPDDVQARAQDAARSLLWALTGRRYGVAVTTAEQFSVASCGSGGHWQPYLGRDGEWRNAACGGDGCVTIQLGNQPARTVTEVRVEGSIVTDWTLAGGQVLLHSGCPACHDCTIAPPIEVDYTWGITVPAMGEAAYGELTCEYIKAMTGESCRLSQRAVSITRQGVTMDFDDASDLFANGMTGLTLCDSFIRATNPNGLRQRSRVVSPDLPRVLR